MRLFILGLWCLSLSIFLQAQDCLPDPGPALFLEDFGSGPNPGPALPPGTTSYIYGSINTGNYVVSNTTGLDPGFWHDGPDRTEGDTNGYMVIFNPSQGEGIFYQRTFPNLCPNTDYVFSCYIANLAVPTACIGIALKPRVRFDVIDTRNDAVQFSKETIEVFYRSFLTWEEYNIQFRTEADQTEAHIQMVNIGGGGCGNDLAIDDISLRLCNVQIDQTFDLCDLPSGSLTVGGKIYTEAGSYFDTLPVPNSCNDTLIITTLMGETRVLSAEVFTFCQGDTLELDNQFYTSSTSIIDTLPGEFADCPRFQTYDIIAQPLQSVQQTVTLCNGDSLRVGDNWYTSAGTYIDTLATPAGCDSVVFTTINTGGIAVDLEPANLEVELGQSIQLMTTVSRSDSYSLSWQPPEAFSCNDCLNPLFQPSSSGVYQIIATDLPSGCIDSTRIEVKVQACDKVFVPTAFSPNGDGLNDRLGFFTQDCFTRLISWRIFDRWGAQVFELSDIPLAGDVVGWDGQVRGQLANRGVYIFQLILEQGDGTPIELRGDVLLMR